MIDKLKGSLMQQILQISHGVFALSFEVNFMLMEASSEVYLSKALLGNS